MILYLKITSILNSALNSSIRCFLRCYLMRKMEKNPGGSFSVKTKKKETTIPTTSRQHAFTHKSQCCHRHHGAIKVESSTITAAAGSLQRGSDNGPEGKRQRAQGPGIVRKTDKKTQEQVISQFMGCHSAQTLTFSAGKSYNHKQASH